MSLGGDERPVLRGGPSGTQSAPSARAGGACVCPEACANVFKSKPLFVWLLTGFRWCALSSFKDQLLPYGSVSRRSLLFLLLIN